MTDCDPIIVAGDDAVILGERDDSEDDESERATLDEFGIVR